MSLSLLHRNPERVAWTTLFVAFFILVLLAVSIPLSLRWYLIHATITLPVQVSPVKGTPLMWERSDEKALALTENRSIGEQTKLRCDSASSALLTIGQGEDLEAVLATVQLYPNGEVSLTQVREPRFSLSNESYKVIVEVLQGRVRVTSAQPAGRPLELVVSTPHTLAEMAAGSYSVEVTEEGTEVAARYGEALLEAAGGSTTIGRGERAIVEWGRVPSSPIPVERNLVENGNFTEPLPNAWEIDTYQQAEGVQEGSVQVVIRAGRRAVQFYRQGEGGIHTETAISQIIDENVQDYDVLTLRLDVRVLAQSLPGGGYLSSEFPLMVRLDYTDIYGREQFWVHGFYITEPDENWPILNGERIPAFVWYPYESGNLIQLLQDTRPAHINSIRVYASGHNYESLAAEVGLIAK